MNKTFEEVKEYCAETYGVIAEEDWFICPECGEPIYKEDYMFDDGYESCPICNFDFYIWGEDN